MLKIRQLNAGYNDIKVLKNLDIEVAEDEIVAVIGPNGAGKSTILKSIFNICQVYSGSVTWLDKSIKNLSTSDLIKEGIAFVTQGRGVFRDLSVRENLEVSAYSINDKKKLNNIINKLLKDNPELLKKEHYYANTLSGGQQQLLALSMALIHSPRLLLLDEPSLGLAPKIIEQIFNKIKDINRAGVAVLIIEQNVNHAINIAKRTYVLEDGRVALAGGREIVSNEKIKNIFFGGI